MGTLFDRGLGPTPDPQVGMTNIPLDGSSTHVTQFDPSSPYRVSWNASSAGNDVPHYTNQDLGKHHPDRHTPPPGYGG